MLPPEYLAGLPDELVELYGKVEGDILADMARRITAYDYDIPAAQHQHQKMRAMGLLEGEIEARLSALTGKSLQELRRLMEQAVEESLTADAALYAAAGMGAVDAMAAEGVKTVLRSGLAQTGGLFTNLTRTTANTAAKQFENALDRAWLQIASGAFDYNAAIRYAVKDLARQGVGAITYPTPTEHVDSLEAAVRRAVVTGCNQTAAKAQLALMDEMGTDLVETTAHAGARPSHQVWQGQIFSRSGHSGKYPDFVSSTGYGTGAGLCGWNCSHSFSPYIEGAPRAYSQALLQDYASESITYNGQRMTGYEATQKQRYIERQIRRWKREYQAMEAAGQSTDEAAAKLSAWRAREADFCRQTGLKRQGERSQIAKALAKSAKGGIIKARAVSGALNPDSKRAIEHAERYYQAVRKMTTDAARIAKNTGYSESEIQRIKNFIFMDEHDLGEGRISRFDASFEMAESWQRLIDGRNIQPHDLTLLRHEIMEKSLMDLGYSQDEAHITTSAQYNYAKEAYQYYHGQTGTD